MLRVVAVLRRRLASPWQALAADLSRVQRVTGPERAQDRRISGEKWLYSRGSGRRVRVPSGTSHESSLLSQLAQAPSRRLPGREAQGNALRHQQDQSEVQGSPRIHPRDAALQEGGQVAVDSRLLVTCSSERRPGGRLFYSVVASWRRSSPAAIIPNVAVMCVAVP